MPRFAERLALSTWCSATAKSLAERSTTIEGDAGAAVAVTATWVHVDPESRRPTRLPPAFADAYATSAAGRKARSSFRHPSFPPPGAERLDWAFVRADIDLAGHVNNTAYWRLAEEHLALERLAGGPGTLAAEYRAGLGHGAATVHRAGDALWITAPGGELAATIRLELGAG